MWSGVRYIAFANHFWDYSLVYFPVYCTFLAFTQCLGCTAVS